MRRDRGDGRAHREARPRSTTATPSPATTRRCTTPCPNCGGVVKENYRRFACTGIRASAKAAASRSARSPAAALRAGRGRGLPARQEDRPARGLPLQGRLAVHRRAQARAATTRSSNWKLEFDFGEDAKKRGRVGRAGRLLGAGEPRPLPEDAGPRLRARHQLRLRARGRRRTSPATSRAARSSCSSRCAREQMTKLLADRQDRPARELRLQQDAAQVQGPPRLRREGRQGELRVRAAAGAAGREAAAAKRPRRRKLRSAAAAKTPTAQGAQRRPRLSRPGRRRRTRRQRIEDRRASARSTSAVLADV